MTYEKGKNTDYQFARRKVAGFANAMYQTRRKKCPKDAQKIKLAVSACKNLHPSTQQPPIFALP
jgi:hypothetical protein